jgi:lactoylglutathione lyase
LEVRYLCQYSVALIRNSCYACTCLLRIKSILEHINIANTRACKRNIQFVQNYTISVGKYELIHFSRINRRITLKYLHTMVRVKDLEQSLAFYCDKLGMVEVRRNDFEQGRFTLVFLSAVDDLGTTKDVSDSTQRAPTLELTYNWDPEQYESGRNFGHLAFAVDDIYQTCRKLMDNGVTINRPPRDGHMAFVRSPDNISIELLQKGGAKPPQEPWASMANEGEW